MQVAHNHHKNDDQREYSNIERVEYFAAGMEQIVNADEILTHRFQTSTNLYLFASDCSYSINGADISVITVYKEDEKG